ncbi:hypothetical protein SCLCIDRAFT_1222468 [Scleroderma citrinum Foug A]|uniref:HNH nuclease domain-containing protein n=1 Tax=Scleroderma citrinum Foug A TaxID=1036808 RepID=A0A0C3DCL6_9AGAM|nr:hypothetical protein SCLCIDRAFT_1222468 [Scleroderma citrinum Foug A]
MSTSSPPGPRRNPSRQGKPLTLPSIQEDSSALHETLTPEKRKKWGSSVDTRQKIRAREADPHGGRCLLRNVDDAINVCHLIPSATDPSELTKLEYAWGVPNGHLNVDSTRNLIHRKFMLIPELSDLQRLKDATITKALTGPSQNNVKKLFRRKTFKYHLLPMPELKAPICRFGDSNDLAVHSTHRRPFSTLGPLVSHVQLQYVVVNAARKLSAIPFAEYVGLPPVLKQIASHKSVDNANSRLVAVVELYSHWTKLVMPDDFVACSRPRSRPRSEDSDNDDQDQDHAEEEQEELEEESEQEENDSEDDELQSTPSKKSNVGRQLHADIASTSSSGSLNTAVDADGWCPSKDTAWVEEINDWTIKCCDAAASEGGWESSIRNGRSPRHNTAKFSSNDWALFEEDTALPVDSE